MILGVAGSHKWDESDPAIARAVVWAYGYLESIILTYNPKAVVSGGAKYVDTWAAELATKHKYQPCSNPEHVHEKCNITHWPKPEAPGRGAYINALFARNKKIVQDADLLIAIMLSPGSPGTMDTIRNATRKGIPVLKVLIDPYQQGSGFAKIEMLNV